MRGLAILFLIVFTYSSRAQTPSDAVSWFNLGVTYQRSEQFAKALDAYQHVIDLQSSLAPAALYYQATVLRTENRLVQARQRLSQIKMDTLPPTLKRDVTALRDELLGLTSKPQLSAFNGVFELDYGRNSNPQTLADITANQVASDRETQVKLGVGYQALAIPSFELRVDYAYSGTFFQHATGSDFVYHDILLPTSFYFGLNRVRVTPEYYFDNYGGPAFSKAFGGAVEFTRKIGNIFLGISFLDQSIKNQTAEYSYLSGSQQKVALNLQSSWSVHSIILSPYVAEFHYQDTASLSSTYQSSGIFGGYGLAILPWTLSLNLGFENHLYPQAENDQFARRDQRWFEQIKFGYALNKNLKFTFEADNTSNFSNFNSSAVDRTYKQTIVLGGVTVSL